MIEWCWLCTRKHEFVVYVAQHVALFEQDLCQLFEQLTALVFLDIYGRISEEKAEQYRRMIGTRLPASLCVITTYRFRLWV